jgi:hypothetical protein
MYRHDFSAKYKSIARKVYSKEGLNYCCTVHTEDALHYHNYSILCLRQVGETSFFGNVNYWCRPVVLTRARMRSVNVALRSGKSMSMLLLTLTADRGKRNNVARENVEDNSLVCQLCAWMIIQVLSSAH